jgi:hypothetical protein
VCSRPGTSLPACPASKGLWHAIAAQRAPGLPPCTHRPAQPSSSPAAPPPSLPPPLAPRTQAGRVPPHPSRTCYPGPAPPPARAPRACGSARCAPPPAPSLACSTTPSAWRPRPAWPAGGRRRSRPGLRGRGRRSDLDPGSWVILCLRGGWGPACWGATIMRPARGCSPQAIAAGGPKPTDDGGAPGHLGGQEAAVPGLLLAKHQGPGLLGAVAHVPHHGGARVGAHGQERAPWAGCAAGGGAGGSGVKRPLRGWGRQPLGAQTLPGRCHCQAARLPELPGCQGAARALPEPPGCSAPLALPRLWPAGPLAPLALSSGPAGPLPGAPLMHTMAPTSGSILSPLAPL